MKPPKGWRWLNIEERIRQGDKVKLGRMKFTPAGLIGFKVGWDNDTPPRCIYIRRLPAKRKPTKKKGKK